MRRRLVAVAVATTSLVAFAFAIPLGLLVRNVARDRALSAAERDTASLAPVLALTTEPGLVSAAIGSTGTGAAGRLTVWAGDEVIGDPTPPEADHLALAREQRLAFSATTPGGISLYQPVVTGDGDVAVVRARVTDDQMSRGLPIAFGALGAVAVALVTGAVVIADRLGRSVTRPTRRLAAVARRLGDGDLDARAGAGGDEPAELAEVGAALDFLAQRIQELLAGERERVADLSHRLRTPLTTLRLEAEASGVPGLVRGVDRLEQAVTDLIAEARRPLGREASPECDLAEVVRRRSEFWGALGDEQQRPRECRVATGDVPVAIPAKAAAAVLDGLLGNVFSHTPDGTAYRVTLHRQGDSAVLAVEDAGPGIEDPVAAVERGHSRRGSSGLGLDIVRRTAAEAGGHLGIDRSDMGGTRVRVVLPLRAHHPGAATRA